MTKKENWALLDEKKLGDKFDSKNIKDYANIIKSLLENARTRRKNICYVHNSLQNKISEWYNSCGWNTTLEAGFNSGGFSSDQVRFDIVAEHKKEMHIIEVKDILNTRDLGQIHGYADILQQKKMKCKLFLGTDFLNYGDCVNGVLGEMIKELMESEDIGVIFIDSAFMLTCFNYNQLMGIEMPEFVVENTDE